MIENLLKKTVISPAEAHDLLKWSRQTLEKQSDVVFVDCTFVLQNSDTDPEEVYKNGHIENALFLSVKDVSDPDNSLPNMLPKRIYFEERLSHLGIHNDNILVLYAQNGIVMGPARLWWMLKGFGHEKVLILDGGLNAWVEQKYPVTSSATSARPTCGYHAQSLKREYVASLQEVVGVCGENSDTCIVDARPANRFSGATAEPRTGMRSGHIPGSVNIPCGSLIDENGFLKDDEELVSIFKSQDINLQTDLRIIASCGSGITACVIFLALYVLGHNNMHVYDGSWSEWGQEGMNTKISKL